MDSDQKLMEPAEIIQRIRNFGFEMFVGGDGVVHGRPVTPGTRVPLEMQPLLEQLRMQNDAIAQLLREDDSRVVVSGLTREAFQPYMDDYRNGKLRLIGNVTYVRSTGLIYCTFDKVV